MTTLSLLSGKYDALSCWSFKFQGECGECRTGNAGQYTQSPLYWRSEIVLSAINNFPPSTIPQYHHLPHSPSEPLSPRCYSIGMATHRHAKRFGPLVSPARDWAPSRAHAHQKLRNEPRKLLKIHKRPPLFRGTDEELGTDESVSALPAGDQLKRLGDGLVRPRFPPPCRQGARTDGVYSSPSPPPTDPRASL